MLKQFRKDLERCAGRVQAISKEFSELVGVTVFAYGRIYDDGRASWVTSNAEQDLFLLDSEIVRYEPTFNTKDAVPEGVRLWFCDESFPGSDEFYAERRKRFQMDHGLILSRHKDGYLENCYFSGHLAKKPLYNLFAKESVLFSSFRDHFVEQLDPMLLDVMSEGVPFSEFGAASKPQPEQFDRDKVLAACGCRELLALSEREKECLILLKDGYTYQMIGKRLHLSERTVEHYLESAKIKLNCETRPELYKAAYKLCGR